MKSLIKSACFVQAAAALLFGTAGPGNAQAAARPSAPPGPPAVLSQTIRGVTATLTGIQWDPADPQHDPFTFSKSFYLSVQLSADRDLPLPPDKSLLSYVTGISAVSSEGYALSTSGGGESRSASGGVTEKSAYWDSIDPRWPLVGIDVDMVDPAAPPRGVGLSTDPITIAGIPVPVEFNKPLTVHAETTTPLDTRIVVEKVEVAPGAERNKTVFVFRVVPDPAATDLQFRFSTGSKVTDDTGARLNPKGGGGSSGGGDLIDPSASFQRGVNSVAITDVPTPGAKTMTLTLDATESSERLKQDQWYRHFHFIVPLRLLDSGSRRPHSPLATVQGKEVAITLDSIGTVESRYRTRYTLQDLTHTGLTWQLDAVRGKDDAGNPLTGKTSLGPAFYWKIDGSPLANNENANEVILGAPGESNNSYGVLVPKPAKTLTLEVDASAVRYESHLLDFVKVPVPPPGRLLALNRAVQDASGARLTLRKVGAYAPEHPIPGFDLSTLPRTESPSPSGIIVVLAEPPDPKGSSRFDFGVTAANDTLKRHLSEADGASPYYVSGDVFQLQAAGDTARVRTYFLHSASPGATTFNLRMGRGTVTPTGKTETLTFPAMDAPTPK